MNIIEVLEQEQLRSDIPDFRAGDTVKVYVKVVQRRRCTRNLYCTPCILWRWRRKNFPSAQPQNRKNRSSTPRYCTPCKTLLSA